MPSRAETVPGLPSAAGLRPLLSTSSGHLPRSISCDDFMANKRMIQAARDCLLKRGGNGMLLETCLQKCKSVGYIAQPDHRRYRAMWRTWPSACGIWRKLMAGKLSWTDLWGPRSARQGKLEKDAICSGSILN